MLKYYYYYKLTITLSDFSQQIFDDFFYAPRFMEYLEKYYPNWYVVNFEQSPIEKQHNLIGVRTLLRLK